MENIGLLIKETRNKKKLTQENLAKQIGINASTLSRWETGDIKNMRRQHIANLSKVLDIPVGKLMGWTPPESDEWISHFKEAYGKDMADDVILIEGTEEKSKPIPLHSSTKRLLENRPIDIEIMAILYDLTQAQKKELLDFAQFLKSKNQEE